LSRNPLGIGYGLKAGNIIITAKARETGTDEAIKQMRRRHDRLSKLTKPRRYRISIASTAGPDALGKTLAQCCNLGEIKEPAFRKDQQLHHIGLAI
jgi:hypothetical protein